MAFWTPYNCGDEMAPLQAPLFIDVICIACQVNYNYKGDLDDDNDRVWVHGVSIRTARGGGGSGQEIYE